jgi:lipopolysaccharide transport system ATP-binding protein
MTKKEIASKIDEIIEFSGCERYIDTPVKRYSSGMRVRLAFAVAAHLEPDILVVDEVLAVGDAEFQKKAIGKMQDISQGEGRTVLFVSHNMAAVEDLCNRAILLEHGEVIFEGGVKDVISKYLYDLNANQSSFDFSDSKKKNSKAFIESFDLLDHSSKDFSKIKSGDQFIFRIGVKINSNLLNPIISLRVSDIQNINVVTWRSNNLKENPLTLRTPGLYYVDIISNNVYLLNSIYSISISLLDGKELLDYYDKFCQFQVHASSPDDRYLNITKENSMNSIVFYPANWKVHER